MSNSVTGERKHIVSRSNAGRNSIHEQNANIDFEFENYIRAIRPNYQISTEILLIQLPQFLFDAFNRDIVVNRGFYAYPPTGLQVIKKVCEELEFKANILDLNYLLLKRIIDDPNFDHMNWLSILDEYLDSHNPFLIGATTISVSTQVTNKNYHLTWLLNHLRQKKSKYLLLAGGPVATNEYRYYLEGGYCDFVIKGEGEEKIRYLLGRISGSKEKISPQSGIFYLNNKLVSESVGESGSVSLGGNLVSTYVDLPIEDYCKVGSLNPFSRMIGINTPFAAFQLNRGCRASCKFCGVPEFMGAGVRSFQAEDILDELRYLVVSRGIRHFEVLDDDFLGGKAALKRVSTDLLKGLAELHKQHQITWAAGNGLIAASITKDTLSLMRESGCVGFRVGIESGNPLMLKAMHKPTSLTALRRMGELLQEFPELFVCGNYILGLFGEETFSQMMDTFNFSRTISLDQAAFSTFQFTSKETIVAKGLRYDGKPATEFVPAKNYGNREIQTENNILTGPDIFLIDKNSTPDKNQIGEIWFAFNLYVNYIDNKNLKRGGSPEKMVSWLNSVQISYPDNPYMPLFGALAKTLCGRKTEAIVDYRRASENLSKSQYWQARFTQFHLCGIVSVMPQSESEVNEVLAEVRGRIDRLIN